MTTKSSSRQLESFQCLPVVDTRNKVPFTPIVLCNGFLPVWHQIIAWADADLFQLDPEHQVLFILHQTTIFSLYRKYS